MTTEEGTVRILSYPDFEPLLRLPESQGEKAGTEFQLEGHTSACYVAELQPTGRHLATGGGDSLISLWDTTNWICVRTITKMTGPVRSLSFTWDGSFVVGGSDDGKKSSYSGAVPCAHIAVDVADFHFLRKAQGWKYPTQRQAMLFIRSRRRARALWSRGRQQGTVWRTVILVS
jgi:WD40 repeat protein